MYILQLCNKSPYPAKEGGPIAMNRLTEQLLALGHNVKIFAVNTPKYTIDINMIDEDYQRITNIELGYIDTSLSAKKALKCLLTNKSYHVERFQNNNFENQLIEILKNNDFQVVILETVYIAVYIETIRKYSTAKIVLRAHNVENNLWKEITQHTKFSLKKLYLAILTIQLKKFEKRVLSQCDSVWCISEKDKHCFEQYKVKSSIDVLPFAWEKQQYKEKVTTFPINLFTIGSMDWQPNTEGLSWFLEKIYPCIREAVPDLQLKIAGRNMSPYWKELHLEGVQVVGEVDNAKQFMAQNGILIVPLLSGSGVRIKILEALAIGKVVISTQKGVEGLDVEHEKNLFIADTAKEFLSTIQQCIDNPYLCNIISENAQQYVSQHHSFLALNRRLENLLKKIC